MATCKDCKYAYRKGHWCDALRKNTMPYHTTCDKFEMSEQAQDELQKEPKMSNLIDVETNTLYVMARSIDLLIYDLDNQLRKVGCFFTPSKRKQFARITSSISKLIEEFDELEKDYSNNLSPRNYELMHRDASELIRLALLFADKCSTNQENNDAIFKQLRAMKGEGIVKEEDIERFYLKKM